MLLLIKNDIGSFLVNAFTVAEINETSFLDTSVVYCMVQAQKQPEQQDVLEFINQTF